MKKIFYKPFVLFVFILSSEFVHAQWEPCNNGLPAGTVTDLASIGNYIFAATGQGLYVSTDNGENWTKTSLDLPLYSINKVSTKGNNVYVGSWGYGVYKSTDNGEIWAPKNTGIETKIVFCFNISENEIYIGTRNEGIFLSTDGGETWIDKGLTGAYVNSIVRIVDTIFAGTNNGMFVRRPSDFIWIPKTNGLTNTFIYPMILSGDSIFAGVVGGVFLTTDIGENWIDKNNGFPNVCVNVMSKIRNYIFTGTEQYGVFMSSDNGDSWIDKNIGLTDMKVRAMGIFGDYIYVGTPTTNLSRAKISDLTTTDVNEQTISGKHISIFPNLVGDILTLNFEKRVVNNSPVRIYNLHGEIVEEKVISAGSKEFKINVESLNAGIYFLQVNNGQSTETQKFVVIR